MPTRVGDVEPPPVEVEVARLSALARRLPKKPEVRGVVVPPELCRGVTARGERPGEAVRGESTAAIADTCCGVWTWSCCCCCCCGRSLATTGSSVSLIERLSAVPLECEVCVRIGRGTSELRRQAGRQADTIVGRTRAGRVVAR